MDSGNAGKELRGPAWASTGIRQKYHMHIKDWRIRLRFLLFGELAIDHVQWVDRKPERARSEVFVSFPGDFPAVTYGHLPNLADLRDKGIAGAQERENDG